MTSQFQKDALKEINRLEKKIHKTIADHENEISELKSYIHILEKQQEPDGVSVNDILAEADKAMKRFNARLRKEGEKHAKQKQSKG